MKRDKEKIKEPYKPEDTPEPPQKIGPEMEEKRENPPEGKGRSSSEPANKSGGRSAKTHLLDENADIDDETTI